MLKIKLNIIVLFLLQSIVLSQSINFKKEKIEISVKDNHCTLTGYYFFENNDLKDKTQTIYYPFVINNSLPYPDSIFVFDNSTLKTLPFRKLKEGIIFDINIPPGSITQIKVQYRQNLIDNYFEYILTTTQNWKKPLESAEFNILLPSSYLNPNISYSEDLTIQGTDYIAYTFTKINFMPDKNLIIKWEVDK